MTRFERWSVWSTTAAMLLTGVAYWWMRDVMTSSDPWAVINHPLQPWMLKAHIMVAPLMVFSVGMITVRHVWSHLARGVRKGRLSGLAAAIGIAVVVVSGYLLQVVSAEVLLRALGWIHLGLGIIYSAAVAAHWPATRKSAVSADRPSAGTPRPSSAFVGTMPRHDRRARRAGSSR